MIDIFILVVVLWAIFNGWKTGVIKEVTSTIGTLLGLLIAATCYSAFGEYLAVNGSETNMVTSIIAFFLLWIVVPIVLGFAANVITHSLKGMQLGMPNSILGALISVVKYLIILSCVLNVMQSLNILNTEKAKNSHLLSPVTGALQVFFPEDTTKVLPPDTTRTATPDTIWVDMTKKQKK